MEKWNVNLNSVDLSKVPVSKIMKDLNAIATGKWSPSMLSPIAIKIGDAIGSQVNDEGFYYHENVVTLPLGGFSYSGTIRKVFESFCLKKQ